MRNLILILSMLICACGATRPPVGLEPVKPELDESGTMTVLRDRQNGKPLNLFEATLLQSVPKRVAQEALLKYDQFADRVAKPDYIVMIDMTQHSGSKRFFLVNRASGKVDSLATAHGSGSDPKNSGYAKRFSNTPDSKMTSLGAYLVHEKYRGKYGDSLRLDGLEATNSNVRARSIVLHPAPYVDDDKSKQGRSWGCPAVPYEWIGRLIDRLEGGAFMYIYGRKEKNIVSSAWENQWNLIPVDRWTNESEDAPFDGD